MPVTAPPCPKSMTFGPCGGVAEDGSCEVAPVPCAFLDLPTVRWPDAPRSRPTERQGLRDLLDRRPVVVADLPAVALSRSSLQQAADLVAGSVDAVLLGDHAAARVQFSPTYRASLVQARGVTVLRDYYKRVRAGSRLVVVGTETRVVKKRKKVKGKVKVVKVRQEVPVRERKPVFKRVLVVADAPTVALVGSSGGTPGAADVTVALDRPGVLGRVSSRVELAAYSDQPASMRAVVDVLLGDRGAPGRLPLDVPGAERRGC